VKERFWGWLAFFGSYNSLVVDATSLSEIKKGYSFIKQFFNIVPKLRPNFKNDNYLCKMP
jgi:hypothetical protein